MAKFLIAYDLTAPGRNYDDLIDHLKSYGTFSHALDSVWMIVTPLSSGEVKDEIKKHIDSNDKVLVVEIANHYAWRNLRTATGEWMTNNIA